MLYIFNQFQLYIYNQKIEKNVVLILNFNFSFYLIQVLFLLNIQ